MSGFWRGRRVFLTGHTGFKGSWLSLWLQRLGAEVMGFALAPESRPALFERVRAADGMVSRIGDIRDFQALKEAVTGFRPEVVLHLAAQALVLEGYRDPLGTYATNVMGTTHLLEAARHCPELRAIVLVTTDKCYENQEWDWGYREGDALGGRDPYSNSKACSELVAQAYRASFFPPGEHARHGVAVATARAGNVIGGGDWAASRLVPDLLRAFESNGEVVLRNPDSRRPWQHVLEPLSGYLVLAEALHREGPVHGGPWNFGPVDGDAWTVLEVANALGSLWGPHARIRVDDSAGRPHEAGQLRLDIAKARARLGWAPRWRLTEALAATCAWHRAHLAGEDLRAFSLAQIEAFEGQGGRP